MKKLIYFSAILILTSCNQENNENEAKSIENENIAESAQIDSAGTSIQSAFPEIFSTRDIHNLIDIFNSDSNGHYERIGFG